MKFLIVAVDYFTKWIEEDPLAKTTTTNAVKFFKKNILSRFGVLQEVITDNGTQFTDKRMRELMNDLNIKKHFTSVEHPQMNGQVESANRVILKGLKRRLEEAKGSWPEVLAHVLWAYRSTPHSTNEETNFCLTFRTKAMIPVKVKELS